MLYAVEDFAHLSKGQWVADDSTNKMVNELIHNYKIKLNDLQGALRESLQFLLGITSWNFEIS
jgi:DNA-directed RNA polymerase subunit beta